MHRGHQLGRESPPLVPGTGRFRVSPPPAVRVLSRSNSPAPSSHNQNQRHIRRRKLIPISQELSEAMRQPRVTDTPQRKSTAPSLEALPSLLTEEETSVKEKASDSGAFTEKYERLVFPGPVGGAPRPAGKGEEEEDSGEMETNTKNKPSTVDTDPSSSNVRHGVFGVRTAEVNMNLTGTHTELFGSMKQSRDGTMTDGIGTMTQHAFTLTGSLRPHQQEEEINLNDTLGQGDRAMLTATSAITATDFTASPKDTSFFTGTQGIESLKHTLRNTSVNLFEQPPPPVPLPTTVSMRTKTALSKLYNEDGGPDTLSSIPGPLPLYDPLSVYMMRRRFGPNDILTLREPALAICSIWSVPSSEDPCEVNPALDSAATASSDKAELYTSHLHTFDSISKAIEEKKRARNTGPKSTMRALQGRDKRPKTVLKKIPVPEPVAGEEVLQNALVARDRLLYVKWSNKPEHDRMLHKVRQWADRVQLVPASNEPHYSSCTDELSLRYGIRRRSLTPKFEEDPVTAHDKIMEAMVEEEHEVRRRNTVDRKRVEQMEVHRRNTNLRFIQEAPEVEDEKAAASSRRGTLMVSAFGTLPAHHSLVAKLNPFDAEPGEANAERVFSLDHDDEESDSDWGRFAQVRQYDSATGIMRDAAGGAIPGPPALDGGHAEDVFLTPIERDLLTFVGLSVVDGTTITHMENLKSNRRQRNNNNNGINSPNDRASLVVGGGLVRRRNTLVTMLGEEEADNRRSVELWDEHSQRSSVHDSDGVERALGVAHAVEKAAVQHYVKRLYHARDLCRLQEVHLFLKEADNTIPPSVPLPSLMAEAGLSHSQSAVADAALYAALPMVLTFSTLPPDTSRKPMDASARARERSMSLSDSVRTWTVRVDGVDLLRMLPNVALRAIFRVKENNAASSSTSLNNNNKKAGGGSSMSGYPASASVSDALPKSAISSWKKLLLDAGTRGYALSAFGGGSEFSSPTDSRRISLLTIGAMRLTAFSVDLRMALTQSRYRSLRLKEMSDVWHLAVNTERLRAKRDSDAMAALDSASRKGSKKETEAESNNLLELVGIMSPLRRRSHRISAYLQSEDMEKETADTSTADHQSSDPLSPRSDAGGGGGGAGAHKGAQVGKHGGPPLASNGIPYAPSARGCYPLDMKNLYVMASLASEEAEHVIIPRLAQIRAAYHTALEQVPKNSGIQVPPPHPPAPGQHQPHAPQRGVTITLPHTGGDGGDAMQQLSTARDRWQLLRSLLEIETEFAMNLRTIYKHEETILQFNQHVDAFNQYQTKQKLTWAPLYRSGVAISYLLCKYLQQEGLELLPEHFVPFLHPVSLFVGCAGGHRELRVKLKKVLIDVVEKAKRVEVHVEALSSRMLEDAADALKECGSAADVVSCLATEEDVLGVALAPVPLPSTRFRDIPPLSSQQNTLSQ